MQRFVLLPIFFIVGAAHHEAPRRDPFELHSQAIGDVLRRILLLDLRRLLENLHVELIFHRLICRFLECAEETTERLTDLVDDELLEEGETPLLRDVQYNHPGIPSTTVYQFVNPLIPEMLLSAVVAEAREMAALQLLAFFEQHLPATTLPRGSSNSPALLIRIS